MHVLLTGARGEIGAPTLAALQRAGHTVTALARSDAAATELVRRGARIARGDLRAPAGWIAQAARTDALVHAAATFDDDEETVDRGFVDALTDAAAGRADPLRVLYTGGCWLYGETGDSVATETSPFDPPEGFRWAVNHSERLHGAAGIEAMTLHPAMVYGDGGGVFDRFIDEAQTTGRITLWGDGAIRWPVVHRDDVGEAYRLALELGEPGAHYNLSAQDGLPTARIADAVARRCGAALPHDLMSREHALAAHGLWAEGPMIDQQMNSSATMRALGWRPRWTDACAFVGAEMKLPE